MPHSAQAGPLGSDESPSRDHPAPFFENHRHAVRPRDCERDPPERAACFSPAYKTDVDDFPNETVGRRISASMLHSPARWLGVYDRLALAACRRARWPLIPGTRARPALRANLSARSAFL